MSIYIYVVHTDDVLTADPEGQHRPMKATMANAGARDACLEPRYASFFIYLPTLLFTNYTLPMYTTTPPPPPDTTEYCHNNECLSHHITRDEYHYHQYDDDNKRSPPHRDETQYYGVQAMPDSSLFYTSSLFKLFQLS
jgi:hypothetical protein